MIRIQNRDDFQFNWVTGALISKLEGLGVLKISTVAKKHDVEDTVKKELIEFMSKGMSDYDIVSLAQTEIPDNIDCNLCKGTDGKWRLEVHVQEQTFTVNKSQVKELSIKAFSKEVERLLEKY